MHASEARSKRLRQLNRCASLYNLSPIVVSSQTLHNEKQWAKHPYSDDGYIVTLDLDLINDTIYHMSGLNSWFWR